MMETKVPEEIASASFHLACPVGARLAALTGRV